MGCLLYIRFTARFVVFVLKMKIVIMLVVDKSYKALSFVPVELALANILSDHSISAVFCCCSKLRGTLLYSLVLFPPEFLNFKFQFNISS